MNSKKALENIKYAPGFMGGHSRYKSVLESRIPFLEDIEIIKQDLDKLENLEKENQELKNTILSLELDTCIPELRKENSKLKEVIKILEDNLQLVLKQDIDPLINRKIYEVEISRNYKIYSGFKITQEEYELLKEVFENE